MMNEQHDERIQKMLDEGIIQPGLENASEVKAYKTLYQALQQEPELRIPLAFSEKVAAQALQQRKLKARTKARWQSLLLVGIIGLSLILSLLTLRYAYPPFFQYMLSHKILVGFIVTSFLAIQVADHWLVRRRWHVRL